MEKYHGVLHDIFKKVQKFIKLIGRKIIAVKKTKNQPLKINIE
jgi:hypothetical protein